MTFTDPTERAALIDGFRSLADYLESNPEVPASSYPVIYVFPPDGDWAGMCGEIDAIAARLAVTSRKTTGGHYIAVRTFGPVEYRAVAIPPRNDTEEGE